MYTAFSIENFKLFEQLTVGPLARVNLIGGENNVGKTALLEALWVHCHPGAPREALRVAGGRDIGGYGRGDLLASLFPQCSADLTIKLRGEGKEWGGDRTLYITRQYRAQRAIIDWGGVSDVELDDDGIGGFDFDSELVFEHTDEFGDGATVRAWVEAEAVSGRWRWALKDDRESAAAGKYPCVFEHPGGRHNLRAIVARFGEAELAGYRPSVEAVVRLLEPGLQRLITVVDGRGNPSIYADFGSGRVLPITMMGEGIRRLLALALAFPKARNGAIFVDEVENGLHHKALVDIWRYVGCLSREFNVQVFATTHRYECIKAAHTAFKVGEVEDELVYMRLQRHYKTRRIECVAYDDLEVFNYALKYRREVR